MGALVGFVKAALATTLSWIFFVVAAPIAVVFVIALAAAALAFVAFEGLAVGIVEVHDRASTSVRRWGAGRRAGGGL